MSAEPVLAALGLGANLGDPASAMARALRMLNDGEGAEVVAVSKLYRTPPWGLVEQPPFINCCALVETSLSPEALMQRCLDIEKELKRVRDVRWGPRLIDIDILTYGTRALQTETVTIPHPRMLERGFVLMPLAEIAPDMAVNGRPVAEWVTEADISGIVAVSDDGSWWTA
ncbi:2-amino-4-hydroxy-6-hydroxymethyldihydropteridine diphosphokinase [Martelella soudanensis]|uniref:2-amino-4-hydroxy-6- hydroxymethyldihydropteridine diphosphokinase n=1 Tax=unclassified Martelella TaxID=2629616 RepID=UPI0015DE17D1|nr:MULTISPECIES: 2-amino-4-hydroxy-6-hydroxymethyldihydropteridine diphosphokinase [unclassified Martelella]